MCLILLDSSVDKLAVGISNKNQLLDFIMYLAWQKQSEMMVYELDKLLKKNNIEKEDIEGIVVSIGPGSYTGVRIALTIAKTISLALSVPIYPISSLRVLSIESKPTICLINARSNRSYFAVYKDDEAIVKDCIKTNDEVLSYIKENPDFLVSGNTKYLGIENKATNELKRMVSLFPILKRIDNPDLVKPVYMKD